ncbi:hypothetical protein [Actinomadura rugatobispora]|uniref:Uncharacterized protein n=1 Tax=Actinomadura rugatobispora TaxID=1994 RepID=A0ABW0ZVD3_9ACTN
MRAATAYSSESCAERTAAVAVTATPSGVALNPLPVASGSRVTCLSWVIQQRDADLGCGIVPYHTEGDPVGGAAQVRVGAGRGSVEETGTCHRDHSR